VRLGEALARNVIELGEVDLGWPKHSRVTVADVGVEHPGRSVEVVAASHIVEIAAAGIFDQWQTAVPGRP